METNFVTQFSERELRRQKQLDLLNQTEKKDSGVKAKVIAKQEDEVFEQFHRKLCYYTLNYFTLNLLSFDCVTSQTLDFLVI